MDSNIIQNIVNQNSKPIAEVMHGYVVLISDRVFMTPSGKFLFESRQQANQAFYNTLNFKVLSRCRGDESMRGHSTRYIWDTFKRESGFTIKYI